ncbi:hypothetical protein C8J38_103319 [Rhizobium sp. PP-WC-2G-219]|nr:hypothetical protein C8J38_103319 [Rhizobium sp. PP-WC-2G-219]
MAHGYEQNEGGINNQKFAVLGLFVAAADSEALIDRQVYLPNIYSHDQRGERSSIHPFEDVFYLEPLLDFASRWAVEIVPQPKSIDYVDRIERGGWRYFYRGTSAVNDLHGTHSMSMSIAADFFRSLTPKVVSGSEFQKLSRFVYEENGISVVSQMRIEEDWAHFSEYHVKPAAIENEDFFISAERIAEKIQNTLGSEHENYYVSCDERYLFQPKWEIAKKIKNKTGINVFWKSDFIDDATMSAMTPLASSLMDFEIAKLSETFVGLSRSTFANLVTFERFGRFYSDRARDYIYNLPGDRCGLRKDRGTRVDPREVCAAFQLA